MPSFLYLIPRNEAAKEAVRNAINRGYRCSINGNVAIGPYCSRIHDDPTKLAVTLVTLGTRDCDGISFVSEGPHPFHCSLEADPESGIVTLVNHGPEGFVTILGKYKEPFSHENPPRAILLPKLNNQFAIGFTRRLDFRIKWKEMETSTALLQAKETAQQTIVDAGLWPSYFDRRIGPTWHSTLNEICIDEIGSSGTSIVHRAIDRDTCRFIAVKNMKTIDDHHVRHDALDKLRNEVEFLSKACHPRIIKFLGSRGWDYNVQIFTEFHALSLSDIASDPSYRQSPGDFQQLCLRAFKHVLEGLDYVHCKGMVHGSINRARIRVSRDYSRVGPDSYNFVLTGFELCVKDNSKTTDPRFGPSVAPEVCNLQVMKTTSKVDIWSLYITMFATQFHEEYMALHDEYLRISEAGKNNRSKLPRAGESVSQKFRNFCLDKATGTVWEMCQHMVKLSPEHRPSAREVMEIIPLMDEIISRIDKKPLLLELKKQGEDEQSTQPGDGSDSSCEEDDQSTELWEGSDGSCGDDEQSMQFGEGSSRTCRENQQSTQLPERFKGAYNKDKRPIPLQNRSNRTREEDEQLRRLGNRLEGSHKGDKRSKRLQSRVDRT